MRKWFVGFAFLISLVLSTGNAWGQAQITTGSIQGTVVDEKGGAVTDSNVEAKKVARWRGFGPGQAPAWTSPHRS